MKVKGVGLGREAKGKEEEGGQGGKWEAGDRKVKRWRTEMKKTWKEMRGKGKRHEGGGERGEGQGIELKGR